MNKTTVNSSREGGPELQPWMERVFLAVGVKVPQKGRERARYAWLGMDMDRFLSFARTLEPGGSLHDALVGYGNVLHGDPRMEEWRIEQARQALRVFKKGTEGWEIKEEQGRTKVKFRILGPAKSHSSSLSAVSSSQPESEGVCVFGIAML